jgi:hypothetical protein
MLGAYDEEGQTMNNYPKGWVRTALGNICLPVENIQPSDNPRQEFTYIDIGSVDIWVYDLRSGKNFSIRQNPITSEDMKDFVRSYSADDRSLRRASELFRRFTYAEIMERDRANLDFQWQKEASAMADSKTPSALLQEILSDLEEAMRQFSSVELSAEPSGANTSHET